MANVITDWSQFYLTDMGLRLRQQTIATGAELTFCFAKIGQGVPIKPENIPLMTDIISAAEKVPVVRSEAEGVTHSVGVRIDNKEFKQPVLMTEIGLFAQIGEEEPVLYGYTYATQGYDSIPAGKVSHYTWTIIIDTVISRAQSITFSYDGSKVYATEEEFDELKQQIAKLDTSGISSLNIAIPISGWAENTDTGGLFIDIPAEGVTENIIPIISIAPGDGAAAAKCGLSTRAQTGDGYIKLYVKTAPEREINADVVLLSPSKNISGGGSAARLLPATATRLGGVKIGSGVSVTDDGTISVTTEGITATDEDVENIIDEIFGEQSN